MGVSSQLAQLGLFGLLAVFAITLSALAHDPGYAVHALIFAAAALLVVAWKAKTFSFDGKTAVANQDEYMDGVVRAGTIATM